MLLYFWDSTGWASRAMQFQACITLQTKEMLTMKMGQKVAELSLTMSSEHIGPGSSTVSLVGSKEIEATVSHPTER